LYEEIPDIHTHWSLSLRERFVPFLPLLENDAGEEDGNDGELESEGKAEKEKRKRAKKEETFVLQYQVYHMLF
jgi:hypothetical protein